MVPVDQVPSATAAAAAAVAIDDAAADVQSVTGKRQLLLGEVRKFSIGAKVQVLRYGAFSSANPATPLESIHPVRSCIHSFLHLSVVRAVGSLIRSLFQSVGAVVSRSSGHSLTQNRSRKLTRLP